MHPILYQSPSADTIIIDIPLSIPSPPRCTIRSSEPPQKPYTLPEPRDPNLVFNQDLLDLHLKLRDSLTAALETARASFTGSYCGPRRVEPSVNANDELDFHGNTSHLASLPFTYTTPQLLSSHNTVFDDISDLYACPIASASDHWTTLTLRYPSPAKTFHIPPRAALLLAPIQSSIEIFASLSAENPFNFILLDPPWPNRSASRASKYKTTNRFDVVPLLQKIPLKSALTQNGLVGVWVTNKPKLRKAVVEDVFPTWGLEYAGEWVWLKVTEQGQPVYDLESRMRKPYEVLIFGRKKGQKKKRSRRKRAKIVDEGDEKEEQAEEKVQQTALPSRTILAVPDIHSRKPCIKQLINPFLPPQYTACEVFGRNLTDGWLTWGDEAIKWNWSDHYVQLPPSNNTSSHEAMQF